MGLGDRQPLLACSVVVGGESLNLSGPQKERVLGVCEGLLTNFSVCAGAPGGP